MKKLIALLLALIMVLSLAACAAKQPSAETPSEEKPADAATETPAEEKPAEETPAQPESKELVSVTIPSYMVGENAGATYFEPAVERFNAKYEGTYQIVLEEVTEADYFQQMSMLAQTGNLPLIIAGAPSDTANFVNTVLVPQKLYYPMNDFLNSHAEIKNLCLDSSVSFSTQENGDIIGVLAVYVPTVGLFYNDELFQPSKAIGEMNVDELSASSARTSSHSRRSTMPGPPRCSSPR